MLHGSPGLVEMEPGIIPEEDRRLPFRENHRMARDDSEPAPDQNQQRKNGSGQPPRQGWLAAEKPGVFPRKNGVQVSTRKSYGFVTTVSAASLSFSRLFSAFTAKTPFAPDGTLERAGAIFWRSITSESRAMLRT